MKRRLFSFWFLALLACALFAPSARAAITCTTISSPGVSINYVNNTTVSLQTFFNVTCTRSSTSDPTSVSYSVTANNGTNPNGINNNATNSGSGATLRYDFYTTAGCGTQWKGNTAINDTITWASGSTTGAITRQTSFWTCIVSAQTATASGLYSDTVTLTATYGTNQTITGTVPVSIYAPALCTITAPPGSMVLNYVAFGAQKTVSTTYAVQCTSQMPYTMATDVTENVIAGIRYVLALSASAANGTGAAQTYTITATANGGQAGTCGGASCSGTRAHTLTISY